MRARSNFRVGIMTILARVICFFTIEIFRILWKLEIILNKTTLIATLHFFGAVFDFFRWRQATEDIWKEEL